MADDGSAVGRTGAGGMAGGRGLQGLLNLY